MMLFGLAILICFVATIYAKKTTFDVFCQGNCAVDVTPSSTVPGVVLMGGGVRISIKS